MKISSQSQLNAGGDKMYQFTCLPVGLASASMGLYQNPKASFSSRMGAWDVGNLLHRQYSLHGRVQKENAGLVSRFDLPVKVPGFHY